MQSREQAANKHETKAIRIIRNEANHKNGPKDLTQAQRKNGKRAGKGGLSGYTEGKGPQNYSHLLGFQAQEDPTEYNPGQTPSGGHGGRRKNRGYSNNRPTFSKE